MLGTQKSGALVPHPLACLGMFDVLPIWVTTLISVALGVGVRRGPQELGALDVLALWFESVAGTLATRLFLDGLPCRIFWL